MFKKVAKALTNPRHAFRLIEERVRDLRETIWVKHDSNALGINEKVLFVDLGANLGQGYSWFAQFYNKDNIEFELFEPNPNCYEELLKLPAVSDGRVTVRNVGVGVKAGKFKFYGLSHDEGGKYSQGGSIVEAHNSDRYKSTGSKAIDVEVIDFMEYLVERAKLFDKIIVKMDIEGAEVELLESLIFKNAVGNIDVLYVEFHSQYQEITQSKKTRKREVAILQQLRKDKSTKVRIWH